MAQEQYAHRLPLLPDTKAMAWVQKNVKWDEFLIYRDEVYLEPIEEKRKHGAKVTCTACGMSSIWPKVPGPKCSYFGTAPFGVVLDGIEKTSGEKCTCPECGTFAKLIHITHAPHGFQQEEWISTIGKIDEKIVVYLWIYQRVITKTGTSVCEIKPYEAYVFEARKAVKLTAYEKVYSKVTLKGSWVQKVKCDDTFGEACNTAPWDPDIFKDSTLENCKLEQYMSVRQKNIKLYPIGYLRLWQKHKNAENLLTAGAERLFAEMIADEMQGGNGTYYSRSFNIPKLDGKIDWSQNQPSKMLGLNRVELREAIQRGWNRYDLEAYKLLRTLDVRLENMKTVRRIGSLQVRRLAENKPRVGIMRLLRYVEKQKSDITYLQDYWRMAAAEGRDLTDMSLYLPRDLRRAHDQLADMINERREAANREYIAKREAERKKTQEERAPRFAARSAQFAAFEWECDGLLIRPVSDENELVAEGKKLSHCVSSYAEKIATGGSFIMVIRKTSEPEKPFFTLELSDSLQVIQNRGKMNCDRTPEVEAFEKKWIEHIKNIGKKGSVA